MTAPTRTPMTTAPKRPIHTFPVIPANTTPPRAAQSIMPSRAMFIIPAFLLITAAMPAKIKGVDSLKTEYPKLPIQSSVSIDYSSFPFKAADSFSAFSLAASSSSAAL